MNGDEGPAAVPARRPVDVSPFELPGGQLRTSAGAAARGWYAPRLAGSPSTTRQAEILNTAVIGNPTGDEGIVNGRDNLSQSMISYDAPTAYNAEPRQISSPNVIVLGTVGYGKSSLTKTVGVAAPLAWRTGVLWCSTRRTRAVRASTRLWPQPRVGAAALRPGRRRNPPEPARPAHHARLGVAGADGTHQRRSSDRAQRRCRDRVGGEGDPVRAARMFEQHGNSTRPLTTTDLMPFLGQVPLDEGLTGASGERFHQAGLSIRFGLENLLETYAGVFDGETSAAVDLGSKLTVFDVSQLPDAGPAVPTVMAVGHQWLLGRLRRERGFITNVVYEEGWHMIGGPSARLVKSNQKLSARWVSRTGS